MGNSTSAPYAVGKNPAKRFCFITQEDVNRAIEIGNKQNLFGSGTIILIEEDGKQTTSPNIWSQLALRRLDHVFVYLFRLDEPSSPGVLYILSFKWSIPNIINVVKVKPDSSDFVLLNREIVTIIGNLDFENLPVSYLTYIAEQE